MKQILEKVLDLLERGDSVELVTIVAGYGSTPRGAGARMVVTADGETFGTIGGGAVEYQSGLLAAELLKKKTSCIREYQLTKEQVAGLGMICGGHVVVYFQYVDAGREDFRALCGEAVAAFGRDENSWLVTDMTDENGWSMKLYRESQMAATAAPDGIDGMDVMEDLFESKPKLTKTETHTFYCEPLVQAGTVYIFGGGHVSQELVPVLSHLGFPCVVYDDREEFANPETFPTAKRTILSDFEDIAGKIAITEHDYLVIMTRGHQYDYLIQRQALKTPARYIGVMGSRNKIRTINEKLREEGFDDSDLSRFHTPIGLPILAQTPAEIAISIAGELVYVRAGGEDA
ncbi:MAG: XdhC family protein [Hungatella hathewayi]|nr:XdhC family protein [Hungatella hathewayi]